MAKQYSLEIIRHSFAHILAAAVLEFYPKAKFGVGPVIENGFYYDFDLGDKISSDDLAKIEEQMKKLIKADLVFEKKIIPINEAVKFFKEKNQNFKVELLEDLVKTGVTKLNKEEQEVIGEKIDSVSLYQTGDFIDLCVGPHIERSGDLSKGAFKLMRLAGAYWRGSEKNQMLTRIYGVAFENKKELDDYLKILEEAAKRDHRIIGEKLEFFAVNEKIGKGLPLWLPKGYFVRRKLEDYIYNIEKENGYSHVLTPHLAKEELYKTSGHLDHYKSDMYAPIEIEGDKYYLKPMNCPHHHMIYQTKLRSYRDLPLRLAEFGTVYRHERSGVLSGLIRVRGFTQNDAHIYISPENLEQEIINILTIHKKVFNDFNIKDYWYRLSLPDFNDKKKYGDIENKELWQAGEKALANALKKLKFDFTEAVGEASFYGPKIDIQIKDVLGKEDTIATIQVDYYSAPKFNLTYIDKDGKEKPPVIIHRAIFGSFDRFFAFLLERTAGELPLWLAPTQIAILPISDKQNKYAIELLEKLKKEGLRIELNDKNETIGKKIRETETQKVPYILVVGEKEEKIKSVAVRERGKGDLGIMPLEKFIEKVKKEIGD